MQYICRIHAAGAERNPVVLCEMDQKWLIPHERHPTHDTHIRLFLRGLRCQPSWLELTMFASTHSACQCLHTHTHTLLSPSLPLKAEVCSDRVAASLAFAIRDTLQNFSVSPSIEGINAEAVCYD